MSWFLRFAVWASVLAPLGWLASHPWQHVLALAVIRVLALFGEPLKAHDTQVTVFESSIL